RILMSVPYATIDRQRNHIADDLENYSKIFLVYYGKSNFDDLNRIRSFSNQLPPPTMKSEAGENAMKSTTDQPTPSHADEAQPSPRYAIRFESSMTRFAELAAASDRAHFAVLESAAGVVLEQILLNLDFAVPDGSEPFRCETIAGTLARHNGDAAGE